MSEITILKIAFGNYTTYYTACPECDHLFILFEKMGSLRTSNCECCEKCRIPLNIDMGGFRQVNTADGNLATFQVEIAKKGYCGKFYRHLCLDESDEDIILK